VVSPSSNVDPVGACVGPRGSRVRMVVSELRGEKIDIIPFNEEPARFVAKALSPARVREVLVDDETKEATVIVPDDQLSLAIGRDGQNARLAAKLTGWKVDIKSETEFSQVEEDIEIEGAEEADGRCAAVLSAGRRCPNAALSGSRYCGLPQHQALARFGTNSVTVLAPLSDEEVATLADADADESALAPLIERAEGAFSGGEEGEAEEEPAAEVAEDEPPEEQPAEDEEVVEEELDVEEVEEEAGPEEAEVASESEASEEAGAAEAVEEAEEPELAEEPEPAAASEKETAE
jgi:transcription termination/antitermination protein NusA